jgi:uncharacterized coiled-coil DUF342 family protein
MEKMEKDEYVKKMEERLAQYDVQLANMRTKGIRVGNGMRREYLSQIKMLEEERDKLFKICGQLKEGRVSAWEELKDGMEKAFADFKAAFDKVKNRFMF